ncbi:MAG: hypothetical protein MI753_01150, partial [Hyphomicrobiales bacterium]|nr:hypothetical protein [Hyphomicrobiales bacterium]
MIRAFAHAVRRTIGVAAIQSDLARLAKRIDAIETHARQENKWRGHFAGKINALIRAQYLGDFLGDEYPF